MGVESCGSGVSLGPQLEQQQCNESERERRFSPRLVGYCVILGYGLECASLLYFKGEVILRHATRRKNSSRPQKNKERGELTKWVETRVNAAKPFQLWKGCHDDEIPLKAITADYAALHL